MEEPAEPTPRWQGGLGVAAVILFVGTGLVGAILRIRFDPASAHDSVQSMRGMWQFLRGWHAWLASAVLVAGILSLADAWIRNRRAARVPIAWYARVAGLGLALAAFFLGSLLPADQQAAESWNHVEAATGTASEHVPVGGVLAAHAVLVPVAGIAWLALVAGRGWRERVASWPTAIQRAAPTAAILAAGAALLALAAPPELGPRPIEGLVASRPDWPFLWLGPFQDWFGVAAGVWAGAATSALFLGAAPWLGAGWSARVRGLVALAAFAAMVALSWRGAA